jgi:hypothetical protein
MAKRPAPDIDELLRTVDEALAMDEARIAEMLLDDAARAARKLDDVTLDRVLRRRAEVALDEAIDDDLPDLAAAAKKTAEVAARATATGADRERHAYTLLLAGKTGGARKATAGDPFVAAAIAYAARPGDAKLEALRRAAGEDPTRLERFVRLVLQRQRHPISSDARRWLAAAGAASPVWDRAVARAVNALASALRLEDDVEGASAARQQWIEACRTAVPPDDPRSFVARSAQLATRPEAEGLADRAARMARLSERFGPASPLLEPALWALSAGAVRAREHEIAIDALEQLDALIASRRGAAGLKRRSVLLDLRKSEMALGRFDRALAVVEREEQLLAALGQPVPAYLARADVAYARGDLDAWVAGHQAELARCESGHGPDLGLDGTTTKLIRSQTKMALERAGRHDEARALA